MKDASANRRQMRDPAKIRAFALAGDARLTLESAKTGARYTFRIGAPDNQGENGRAPIWFASLLTGSDNESNYTYFGNIKQRPAGEFFEVGRKSRLGADSTPVKAFAWFWARLMRGEVPADLNVWHEGRCCRCGRVLTVPSSIESGIGPECVKKVGGFRAEPVDAEAPLTPADRDGALNKGFVGKTVGAYTAPGFFDTRKRPPAKTVMHARPFDDSLDGVFG